MNPRAAVSRTPVLFVLAIALSVAAGCAASTRESTLKATYLAVDTSHEAYLQYDLKHKNDIADAAVSAATKAKTLEEGKAALEEGRARLAAYMEKRAKLDKAYDVAYHAIAVAIRVNDDPSWAAAKAAVADAMAAANALTGGAK